ncbi:hypothetical protein ACQKP0_14990 [Heyndrickxia sp. NPDC080065]|uniref:hypothetical protein n=1 Tax=Heyndrickxia sp. NPDC080065 TaxID=3390568 RepID=UPI003D0787E9
MLNWLFSSKEREIITISVDYYDSPADLNLYWDDVLEVLALAEDGSKESVTKLKEKYKLEILYGDHLYVTLTAPKSENYSSSRDHYPGDSYDFSVKMIQDIYEQEVKNRARKKELEDKKEKEKMVEQERNSIENLQKQLTKLNIKKRPNPYH